MAKISDQLKETAFSIAQKLDEVKTQSSVDLIIDDNLLDDSVLAIPKLYSKYLNQYTSESIILKELYALKDRLHLERWKYYQGKSTDKYYAEHGIIHEKILKSDLDKYLDADPILQAVNLVITYQKSLVDHLEKIMKELSNRNFHVKAIIDWRRFVNGV